MFASTLRSQVKPGLSSRLSECPSFRRMRVCPVEEAFPFPGIRQSGVSSTRGCESTSSEIRNLVPTRRVLKSVLRSQPVSLYHPVLCQQSSHPTPWWASTLSPWTSLSTRTGPGSSTPTQVVACFQAARNRRRRFRKMSASQPRSGELSRRTCLGSPFSKGKKLT